MGIKNFLRPLVPQPVWQSLGFIGRLPIYWRLDRSEDLRVRGGRPILVVFVTKEFFVSVPESLTAYVSWRQHALEDPSSSLEAREFLELSADKKALLDIGAQTGFISALFARSRSGSYNIASLEPDPQVLSILARAKELNNTASGEWDILPVAVSSETGYTTLFVSNTVHETLGRHAEQGDEIQVATVTLRDLAKTVGWTPDIVKIDVESYEHEILTSSMDFIAEAKPALQLEIHWELLTARGREAQEFLEPLYDLGYRGLRRRYRDISSWNQEAGSEPVSRLSLRV